MVQIYSVSQSMSVASYCRVRTNALAIRWFRSHLILAMAHWSHRQLFILLLGGLLAFGVSVSVIQAGDMTMKMAMTSNMDASGQDGCGGCGGGDIGDAGANACASVCTVLTYAMTATGFVVGDVPPSGSPFPTHQLSFGRSSSPDPDPPRSLYLI